MPVTHNFQLLIDGQPCDITSIDDLGLKISYGLEDGENFRQKQSSMALNISLPATGNNNAIFNNFYNPSVADMSGTDRFTNPRSCQVVVNGVEILTGTTLLQNGNASRLPEGYDIDTYGNNGDWLMDIQDITLWDCLGTGVGSAMSNLHEFTVAVVEASWTLFNSDEAHDYVYAPVRYRQPFGQNDDTCSIFHLRPAISPYWLLTRGFRILGYSINSLFMKTAFFQNLVLPWVFGDFYDLNSQLISGISFKTVGDIQDMLINEYPPSTVPASTKIWTGTGSGTLTPSTHGTSWIDTTCNSGLDPLLITILPTGGDYVFTGNLLPKNHFRMTNDLPPSGYDAFGLYSFDDATGTMQWVYNPPPEIASHFSNNITANFELNLLLVITTGSQNCQFAIEITHLFASLAPTVVTNQSILPGGAVITPATHYPDASGYPITPTIWTGSVPNISKGDTLQFRLRALAGGGTGLCTFLVFQSGLLNLKPGAGISQNWQFDFTTGKYRNVIEAIPNTQWQQQFSSFSMTGLQLAVGNPVDFQNYDSFRSHKLLDLLTGFCDMFDWSIQTDPIQKIVTIEPTHPYVNPNGTPMPGYFVPDRLDWTAKQDINKTTANHLFSDYTRQLDFSMKGDGSDGGANIYAGRNLSYYLNNKITNPVNNTNIENGFIAAIPGASRFMFPQRFRKGKTNITNGFFSPTMHYNHDRWANINVIEAGAPAPVAPQLICIIPENVSNTSASDIAQTFEPKIAYYAGQQAISKFGWRWCGDPAGRGYDGAGNGVPTYNSPSDYIIDLSTGLPQPASLYSSIGFGLPYMFAVDYLNAVVDAPTLTYSDQLVAGATIKTGLMKRFFLKRLAKMRNGKQYNPFINLNLGDITDWEHRNTIILNGELYNIIGIKDFDPFSDKSTQVTMWKLENPNENDIANCYPSNTSILTSPPSLSQFDTPYAQLLLFYTDMPQSL